MFIEAKSKLLVIGNLITDCGRGKQVGETFKDRLGNGFVSLQNVAIQPRFLNSFGPVLQGLGQVWGLDLVIPRQVGNCARQLQGAVIGAGG